MINNGNEEYHRLWFSFKNTKKKDLIQKDKEKLFFIL